MAKFRTSAELRDYATGRPPPSVSGPHADVVSVMVEAMHSEQGVDVPLLEVCFFGHICRQPPDKSLHWPSVESRHGFRHGSRTVMIFSSREVRQ